MLEINQTFLEAKFNKEEWDSFEQFKDFYITYFQETQNHDVKYLDEEGNETVFKPIIHFPNLKKYEIWSEGTILPNGTRISSFLVGAELGRNFAEACHKFACKKYLNDLTMSDKLLKNINTVGMFEYDSEDLSFMGLKWYWNKDVASRAFG